MALKPTIFKLNIDLSDSDSNRYDSFSLTLARHPSETHERMSVRMLVYCLHYHRNLEICRGLSNTDEPALWQRSDSGEIEHWIDVGQPEEGRLKKACGRSLQTSVYAFGRSAPTWWQQKQALISELPRIAVWSLDWETLTRLAATIDRGSSISVSIAGGVIYLDCGGQSLQLEPELWLNNTA